MFFDLNVPIPTTNISGSQQPKKSKGKQPQTSSQSQVAPLYTPAQIKAIEARIDILVYLGYSVIALSQVVEKRLDAKTHVNMVDPLVGQLKKRQRVIYLKRLTIVLDEESEKGFGLTNANASLVEPYDLIALVPTTIATFSLACLTHSLPSPLTAHIISLPLTTPRLPFHLKHTLVRTAIKNGAVFEINYAGAVGGDLESSSLAAGSERQAATRRNWWAAAREVIRVTKGKGILVSGEIADVNFRAPRDVGNLLTLLGLSQNVAHDASTNVAKALVLRAQTRRTHRAVLSEPKIVLPSNSNSIEARTSGTSHTSQPDESTMDPLIDVDLPRDLPHHERNSNGSYASGETPLQNGDSAAPAATLNEKTKRTRDEIEGVAGGDGNEALQHIANGARSKEHDGGARKKKKRKGGLTEQVV